MTLAEYIAEVTEAFDVYLFHNLDNYFWWDKTERRLALAGRLHEIGYGVACAGGELEDARRLGAPLWNAIIRRLILSGVRLDIAGIRFVTARLVVGFRQYEGEGGA